MGRMYFVLYLVSKQEELLSSLKAETQERKLSSSSHSKPEIKYIH
jgi:hypothetical protein